MSVVENGNAQMLLNGSWQVDPAASAVEFRVRHLMIATLKGRFREFDGAIVPGEALSLAGSIKVASVADIVSGCQSFPDSVSRTRIVAPLLITTSGGRGWSMRA